MTNPDDDIVNEHIRHTEEHATVHQSFYSKLYTALYQRLNVYGRSICTSPSLVEDTVQELFEYFLSNKGKLEQVDDIAAYLTTSLRHRLFKKISQQKHIQALDELHRTYSSTSVEYRLIERETADHQQKRLHTAIARLPEGEANALKARFLEEKSYELIAKENNSSKRTVYNQVHNGIQKLKRLF